MRVRTITHPPFLASAAAVPLGTAYWLLVEPTAGLGQAAAILATLGAAITGTCLFAAYAGYRLRRRRYQHVLAAEGGSWRSRWLSVRRAGQLHVQHAPAPARTRAAG